MASKKIKRVGPCMRAAVEYVAQHPGCSILPVAVWVGPHGSTNFGYRAVHRAIDAGLIHAEYVKGRYVLTLPAAQN